MTSSDAVAGRYALGSLLGTGGVAHVYRARDLLLQRDVAIKLFGPGIDLAGPERERSEMRTLANLTHPHLVTVFDAGTDRSVDPPRAFLVMALVDGPSLGECLPLDARAARRVGRDVAGALAYVHERGIVHRDVKPANILLDARGAAYLADFGVAQSLGATALTATGSTVGTAPYLSPEQVRGGLVERPTDVYALGLVLLEALTGEREYAGSSAEAALARLSRPPRLAGRVPPAWEGLLTAMTETDPAARPTADQVAVALQDEALGDSGSAATSVLPGAAPSDAVDRTRVLTGTTPGLEPSDSTAALPGRADDGTAALPGRADDKTAALPGRAGAPTADGAVPRPAPHRRRALLTAAAAAVLVALVAVGLLASRGSDPAEVPDAPAGAPGPARLDADLARLQELVEP